jgi:predicted alpha/beta-fold hydrolase
MNNIREKKMNRRIWVVGGSIGAVVLLLLLSFQSVAASNVHQQTINEKYNLIRDYVHTLSSLNPKFDIFKIWDVLTYIFHVFLSLILWFSFRHPPS